MSKLDEYWKKFVAEKKLDPQTTCSGDLFFEAKGFVRDELTSLVVTGRKTAFFSSFATFTIDQEPLPLSGELYIVVDREGNPSCVIELTDVVVIPFNEVSWDMAAREGEDQNLEEWKEKKQELLEEEGHIVGFDFSPDIKLVFQAFKVIYK